LAEVRIKTWLKRGFLALIIVATPLLLLAGYFVWRFIPFPPEPDYPPPENVAEAYRQDLDYLRLYPTLDRSFSALEAAAFQAAVDRIETQVDSLTPPGFELAVARAVALADNAHTNVSPIRRRARVNAIPLRLAWFDDGVYVIQARNDYAELLGARVDTLAGATPAAIADTLADSFGGHPGRARWLSVLSLESPDLLHAAGFAPANDRVTVAMTLRSGRQTTRTIPAIEPLTDPAERRYGGRLLAYDVPAPMQGEWTHLMAGEAPPLYLTDADRPFSATWLETPAGDGLYLELDMTMDTEGYVLVDFQRGVLADLERHSARFLVVDLRRNGGGTVDDWFSRGVVERLAPEVPIFVVTSPETFSGGIAEAAYFKHFGGDRARVVGGPVGDRLVFWANGGTPMVLPNSGIPLNVWVAKEDWENGCDDWRLCFWFTMIEDVGVGTLAPDLPVSLSFADYVAGRDPALEAILAQLGAR
jgi:hypothetical protein